jgi:hypothetical protein
MSLPGKCQRCFLPIVGLSYMLRLDSQPPRPDALEVLLCESCVESMSLWLTRRNRRTEGFETGASAPVDPPGGRARRASARAHSEALDRFESDSRQKLMIGLFFGTILVAVLIAATVFALINAPALKPRPQPATIVSEEP